jgi:hypothetical protein
VSRTVVYAGEDDKLAVGVALTPQSGNAVTLRATVLGFDGRVAGLDIRFGVESGGTTRSATATACGAGCYSATLPLAGRPQRVSARIAGPGRTPATLRFTGPAQWPAPQGLDIMRRAEITIDGLHSLVVHSHLASDSQHAVTTIYKMIAPDRLSYHNVGSSDSIIIGNRRRDRDLGGRRVSRRRSRRSSSRPRSGRPTSSTHRCFARLASTDVPRGSCRSSTPVRRRGSRRGSTSRATERYAWRWSRPRISCTTATSPSTRRYASSHRLGGGAASI